MRQHFWPAILGLAIVNGLFSPLLLPVIVLRPLWYPDLLPAHISFVFFLSSLIVSTLTLMVAGIPAAIYERVMNAKETDTTSLWIWLAGVALISLPAITNAIAVMR